MTAISDPQKGDRGLSPTMNSNSRSDFYKCRCRKRDRRRGKRSDDAILAAPKNFATCQLRRAGDRICMWLAVLVLVHLCQCEAFVCNSPLMESSLISGMPSRHGAAHCSRSQTRHRLSASDRNGEHTERNGHQHPSLIENTIPRHVAFICDGNSRWALARGLPASAGHLAGADRLIDTLETLKRSGVECCTFYGFSTENWKRSDAEIRDILYVMEQTARKFYDKAVKEHVRVKILGDLEDSRIPRGLQEILYKLERDTADFSPTTLTVCIAINYGGRQDILNASVKLSQAIASGELKEDQVTEDDFSSLLYTSDIPDPDLMIRTGGEKRLSNFLLWNCAYSELYFSQDLWPDFDEASILEALEWYSSRSRRFGGRMTSQVATVGERRCAGQHVQ